MIELNGVTVEFKKAFKGKSILALDNISLKINHGEFFALIGRNGAGKSTAMYCLLGLIKPTIGTVTIDGKTPYPGSELYGKIGYLPEEPHYHSYLTIRESLEYYSALYKKSISNKQINGVLDRLNLTEFKDLRISKCSKGMKQKMGIAQAIITEPELLFLDEPTRGLDPVIVKEFKDIIKSLHKSGTTIIMNSHNLSEVENMATSVAIIDGGKLIRFDSVENITRCDLEVYGVEFEITPSPPDYFTETSRTKTSLKGIIPPEKLDDFNTFIRTSNLKLISCALTKSSLEDSFIKIVKGLENNA